MFFQVFSDNLERYGMVVGIPEPRIERVLVYPDSEGLKVKPWSLSDICLVRVVCVAGVRAGNLMTVMDGHSQLEQNRKAKLAERIRSQHSRNNRDVKCQESRVKCQDGQTIKQSPQMNQAKL